MDVNIAPVINQAKKKAKDELSAKEANTQATLNNYMSDPTATASFYGTADERAHQAANLSQVGVMTGQNMFHTGQQQQDYFQSLQERRHGDDSVAEGMRNGRNRNLANVGRSMAGRGVAGGVAGAAMNSAQNTADAGINAQSQEFGRQNDQDFWNYVKRNQKVTGDALSGGAERGLADGMDTSGAGGAFGTVICTELHRQGIMDSKTYLLDVEFGRLLEKEMPHVIRGYQYMATPVAGLMKKSPLFTKLITPFGMAWANSIAGKPNFLGSVIFNVGVPFCGMVGRFLPRKQAVA